MTWREFKARVEANNVTDETVVAWIDVLGRSHVPIEITRLRSGAVVIATPGPIRPRP